MLELLQVPVEEAGAQAEAEAAESREPPGEAAAEAEAAESREPLPEAEVQADEVSSHTEVGDASRAITIAQPSGLR